MSNSPTNAILLLLYLIPSAFDYRLNSFHFSIADEIANYSTSVPLSVWNDTLLNWCETSIFYV